MPEMITLLIFIIVLGLCIMANLSVIIALSIGLILFIFYAFHKKYALKEIGHMILSGLKETKGILIIFSMVGMLTALWRAGGTIPFILYHTVPIIDPRFFVMSTFLLCSLISTLTGTSFGTVSTMGVICMMTGRALGIPTFHLGGAILSGIFVGDRCSPVSSSALLVRQLTDTDIYTNIKNMIKTSAFPFISTAIFYGIAGYSDTSGKVSSESVAFFADSFNLSPWVITPAVIIFLFTLLKIDIKMTMLSSILAGALVCILCQGMNARSLLQCMIMGYHSDNPYFVLMDGGGIISMLHTIAIIAISSSYFGIFRHTPLLDRIKSWCHTLAQRSTSFATVLIISIITAALSCNQTLATMLTFEIAEKIVPDRKALAIYLENSVILVSALIPWNIAGAFPIATMNAPINSILFAVYLYLVPLWNLLLSFKGEKSSLFLN